LEGRGFGVGEVMKSVGIVSTIRNY